MLPGRRISWRVAGPSLTFSQTEKIVPVDTLQSILDDPSSGSKATQYLPFKIIMKKITYIISSIVKFVHLRALAGQ